MKLRYYATVFLCILLCLVTVGCSSKGKVSRPVTDGFSGRMTANYRSLSLSGTVTRKIDGKLLLSFDDPPSLSGIAIGWDGQRMTMELAGMSISVSPEKVPESALIQGLLGVLSQTGESGELTEEGYVFSGTMDDKAYALVCDPQTGLPRSLTVPSDELEIIFEDVTLIEA